MAKSIIQLVDELPEDNITVKVLKALDFVAPGEWNNVIGFDLTITHFTGETDPKIIQRIRDRAAALYLDPAQGYQGAVQLYQTIDKADVAMGTAALANKVSEKLSFLSFLGNLTPKAETTQTIDLLLKIVVEVIAFCKLNGIPQPNPQLFANSLAKNYHNAGLIRMVALVCEDLRGEGEIEFSIGDMVEVWDKKEEDWYEATIRKVKVKKDKPRYYVHYVGSGSSEDEWIKEKNVRAGNFEEADDNGYAVGQKVKVWDDDEEEWYTARIQKIDGAQYRVHYLDEDDLNDEWVDLDEIC
ncbi:Tudor-knot domain-containing protein [Roseofilum reptotaenium CS-1145]|uniref:Tudor domain-containing protein n=1 Tax=Roseofilum reptotaenium AO1-A TaxID=1925591 RepID=A0A1L9QTA6_9CYAN|nr:Tudor-knot domain-containing protein [Roseofilum reptotaenium]MDB9519757.1 Tudor-knot domain-containing protein [Roseofilum reptotaenium CS-1145]OJJ25920.1 hypothetical protein BI308_09315 [Roseofilum reptotaenium AO1-A]